MAEVIFNYEGNITNINCDINDKMKDIIDKFIARIEKKEDELIFLYNCTIIKNDLTFMEIANEIDKERKKMNIIVINNKEEKNEIKSIISKDIICPECLDNSLLDIKDFKINLNGCKNNHLQNNILLHLFKETQKIDLSKVNCDICKKNSINNTHDNEFYICNTCNKNMCPLCKSNHSKDHLIIDYEDKNFKCNLHKDNFTKHCNKCNKDICIYCEEEHNDHETLDFRTILIDKKELVNTNENLKIVLDKFKNKINTIKEIFDKMVIILDDYYKINNDIINNYNINKRNYNILKTLNNLKIDNEKVIKDLTNVINSDNILDLYEFSFNNFYNNNGERYIGEFKKGLKDGKGILFYDKNDENNRKKYEGDFKNDKREGKGIMYWNNGNRYEGDFKNDKREGKGTMYWIDGDRYEGDWKNSKKEGKGIYYFNSGDRYEGDWYDSKREGLGKMFYINGDKYKGEWKNDKREGVGTLLYKDGKKDEGIWENDKYKGKGKSLFDL